MSRLYLRQVRAIVAGVQIDALKIQFEVKRVLSGNKTDGFIRVFNLNESTETKIREKAVRAQLFAGYGDGYVGPSRGTVSTSGPTPPMIHDGQVSQVERLPIPGNDRVTHITMEGNVFKLSDAFVTLSYSGRVTVRQVVQDAVPTFGLDLGSIENIPEGADLYDFCWSGKTGDLLDNILLPAEVQWVEQDNTIEFSLRGVPVFEEVFLLSPGSGLIASPGVTDKGIKCRSQLNGRLVLGGLVQIASASLGAPANGDASSARSGESGGVYKITQLVHRGDNWDGEFVTEIEGVPL